MTRLRDSWRWMCSAAIGIGLWLLASGLARAQSSGGKDSGGGGGASYVLPYALVIFCTALGVFLVVHPSKRRERAKPEAYGKPK